MKEFVWHDRQSGNGHWPRIGIPVLRFWARALAVRRLHFLSQEEIEEKKAFSFSSGRNNSEENRRLWEANSDEQENV